MKIIELASKILENIYPFSSDMISFEVSFLGFKIITLKDNFSYVYLQQILNTHLVIEICRL